MRALQIVTLDGPEALQVAEVDEPAAGPDQVVVEVHAAGVTFPELLQTRGLYQLKPPLPFTPGSEVAGVVRSAPEGSGFAAGDRVAAFPGLGGWAEVIATAPGHVFPLPDRLSFAAGAALPMNYLTCQFALSHRGRVQAGETVLVHGAAGGIGTAATQLAKALGARVVAVVSTAEKGQVAKAAGADDVVLAEGFLAQVKELTGGAGVDVVVDPVGGDRFTDSLRSLRADGRLLVIGFTGGEIPTVKVNRLLLNNISVVGVGWGAYALPRPGFLAAQWAELLPLLESGAIDPPVSASYPLERAAEALADLEGRRVHGKAVLAVR